MRKPDLSPNPPTGNGHANGHDGEHSEQEPGGFELPAPDEDRGGDRRGKLEDDPRAVLKLEPQRYRDLVHEIILRARHAALPIYQHGPYLSRPVLSQRTFKKDGQDVTVVVGAMIAYIPNTLRHALEEVMLFVKWDGRAKGWKPAPCPDELINRLLGHAEANAFPPIKGLLRTPILRSDLTLLCRPGYDAQTGYYVFDLPDLPPLDLTKEGAQRALETLKDLLSEFEFESERDLSVALSGLLTPLVRAACNVVPAHLFTAPSVGSGKSFLVDLIAAIATGQTAFACTANERQEESDKQLIGSLIEGHQIIFLDNVMTDIRSPVLAQAIERPFIEARALGKSDKIQIENAFCVFITGNNARVAGDNTRRVITGRMHSKFENPIDREFEKDPLKTILDARGEYVAACLTIVLAYLQACSEADEPPVSSKPLPSFRDWSRFVRDALVWLDLPDPVESIRDSFAHDPAIVNLGILMEALANAPLVSPWTIKSAIQVATETYPFTDANGARHSQAGEKIRPELFDAMITVAEAKGDINAAKFGNFLDRNEGRVVGGRRIVSVRQGNKHAPGLWQLI